MQVRLRILGGPGAGKEIPVSTPVFLIGRGEKCHLRPRSEAVSERHCALLPGQARLVLHDFQSASGTYVNDRPVEGRVTLRSGDVIRVGPLQFEVAIDLGTGDGNRDVGEPPGRSAPVARNAESAGAGANDTGPPEGNRRRRIGPGERWLEEVVGFLPTRQGQEGTGKTPGAAAGRPRREFAGSRRGYAPPDFQTPLTRSAPCETMSPRRPGSTDRSRSSV